MKVNVFYRLQKDKYKLVFQGRSALVDKDIWNNFIDEEHNRENGSLREAQVIQLSILNPTFDETRANWAKRNNSVQVYCAVLALIPKNALSPEENNYCEREQKKDYECELWEHIGLAIWRCRSGDWTSALIALSEYRDSGKPINMRIHKDTATWFRDVEVVEYLEGG